MIFRNCSFAELLRVSAYELPDRVPAGNESMRNGPQVRGERFETEQKDNAQP